MIEGVPIGRVLTLNVATPEELSVPAPIDVAPFRKFTVPVGIAMPEAAVTVAVRFTAAPAVIDVGEAVSAVAVFTFVAAATTTVVEPDEEPL